MGDAATAAAERKDPSFLTEVPRHGSPPNRRQSQHPQGKHDKDDTSIRGAERIHAYSAATEIFQIIDKFGEKQQHSKNIRSLIQKAAQKTILVVRTKNATQAAENVTIRFNKNRITEVPRSVVLGDICTKVLASAKFSSSRRRQLFNELFQTAPEYEALLKDMFWYLTAHCFQSGRQKQLEESYYHRISDNFTSLFIRVQVQPASRDSGFFDMLPDIIAQILFMALYEGFPKSRKSMLGSDLREKILQTSYCWILGFVPVDLDWSHWMAVDQESPKRIAALADFPAMRNRMLRAERIERTKLEVKNRHGSVFDETGNENDFIDEIDEEEYRDKLPTVHNCHTGSLQNSLYVQTQERCVYQMQNSPLVDVFLKQHQLQANANNLKVQLRMTGGKHFDLNKQEALHSTTLPRQRRRRLVNPKSYVEAVGKIESFGDSVRSAYQTEKKNTRDLDLNDRRTLMEEQRQLATRFDELRLHRGKLHEFSNMLVSRGRITKIGPTKDTIAFPPDKSPHADPSELKPRPPPRRPN